MPESKKTDIVRPLPVLAKRSPLTRTDFIKFISRDLDDYSDLSFTKEETGQIARHLKVMGTGPISVLPVRCSKQCSWKDRCIFERMGRAPYGRSCLAELNLLREWRLAYFDEYEVDPNSFTEVTIINELAEIEMLLWRVNMGLSLPENASLIQENVVGLSKQGEPIVQKQASSLLEVRDKLQTRKSKLVKMMIGDRQEKYKREAALKRREDKDPSQTMAELRRRLENIKRELAKKESEFGANADIIDVESESGGGGLSPDDILTGTKSGEDL